eukprot:9081552-Pyramimonas_sp.AAC.1
MYPYPPPFGAPGRPFRGGYGYITASHPRAFLRLPLSLSGHSKPHAGRGLLESASGTSWGLLEASEGAL